MTNEEKALAWEKVLELFIREFRQYNYPSLCRMFLYSNNYTLTPQEKIYIDKIIDYDVELKVAENSPWGAYLFDTYDFESRLGYINNKIKFLRS